MTVPAEISQIPVVSEAVEQMLTDAGCPMKAQTRIMIALDEIINNIASYAYPEGKGELTVEYGLEDDTAYVRFIDSGMAYNPLEKQDPDVSLGADARTVGGLGIFMVKKSMDAVDYRREDGKNIFTIRKKIR